MGSFCLNPNVIIRKYDATFSKILDMVSDANEKQKLAKALDSFKGCVKDTFYSYYQGKMEMKPYHDIRNAAVLDTLIKPSLQKLDKAFKSTSSIIAKTVRNQNTLVQKGGNDDIFIFVVNNNAPGINIFPSDYRAVWEKNWKWWHWLLLLPLLDFLVDIIMFVLYIVVNCGFYCTIGIFILLGEFAGGGDERSLDIEQQSHLEVFPLLLAINMAGNGKSLHEIISFLSSFNRPNSVISNLTSFVASSLCRPNQQTVKQNMTNIRNEVKTYKYSGENILIKRFVELMKNDNVQGYKQITKQDLDVFKVKLKNTLKRSVRKE